MLILFPGIYFWPVPKSLRHASELYRPLPQPSSAAHVASQHSWTLLTVVPHCQDWKVADVMPEKRLKGRCRDQEAQQTFQANEQKLEYKNY